MPIGVLPSWNQVWNQVRRARLRRSRCGVFLLAGIALGMVLGKLSLPAKSQDATPSPLWDQSLSARECAARMAQQAQVLQRLLPEPARHELIRRVIVLGDSSQWGYDIRSTQWDQDSRLVAPDRRNFYRSQAARVFSQAGTKWQMRGSVGQVYRGIRPQFSPAFQSLAHSNFKFRKREDWEGPSFDLARDWRLPLLENEHFQKALEDPSQAPISERLGVGSESFIPKDSEAVFLILHGAGANLSQSGSTLMLAELLAAAEKQRTFMNRQDIVGRVLESLGELSFPSSFVSLDLPGSGLAPPVGQFMNLESSLAWLDREIQALRQKIASHQKENQLEKPIPLVVIARSFSPALILELQARSASPVAEAFVFIGPEHQSPEFEFNEANERILEIFREGSFRPNEQGLHWAIELGHEMRWYEELDPFQGIPSLVLLGEEDPERRGPAVEEWRRLANRLDHVTFEEIAGTAHDVFSHRHFDAALGSYRSLYEFVRGLRP